MCAPKIQLHSNHIGATGEVFAIEIKVEKGIISYFSYDIAAIQAVDFAFDLSGNFNIQIGVFPKKEFSANDFLKGARSCNWSADPV